ncbi:hypothetical protein BU15DRAFT_31894, partial [Melanogaster broomeanus]
EESQSSSTQEQSSDDDDRTRQNSKSKGKEKRTAKRAQQRSPSLEEVDAGDMSQEIQEIAPSSRAGSIAEVEIDEENSDGLEENHRADIPAMVIPKRQHAEDLLTIFSEKCTVKFCHTDGRVETLKGRWCNECRSDEKLIRAHGKRKVFHLGLNSSCRQHIRSHFEIYKMRCEEKGIKVHHHTVPPGLTK